jgi:Na+-driven multidrug efflux pump
LSVVVAILVGLADWYLLPVFKLSRPMVFAAAVTEPFLAALLALWIVRKVKKT